MLKGRLRSHCLNLHLMVGITGIQVNINCTVIMQISMDFNSISVLKDSDSSDSEDCLSQLEPHPDGQDFFGMKMLDTLKTAFTILLQLIFMFSVYQR